MHLPRGRAWGLGRREREQRARRCSVSTTDNIVATGHMRIREVMAEGIQVTLQQRRLDPGRSASMRIFFSKCAQCCVFPLTILITFPAALV